jgi:hypothetical protein
MESENMEKKRCQREGDGIKQKAAKKEGRTTSKDFRIEGS